MSAAIPRLVLDTNILLAGLVSNASASQKIVDAISLRKSIVLVSAAVMAEYRAVLLHPVIHARFPDLDAKKVELALQRFRYLGDECRIGRIRFELERDPRDAKFIELAIVGSATHLITLDRDILSLPTVRTDAGKRFRQRLPRIAVQRPGEFVRSNGGLF